jgi:hypothetical protein
MHDEVGIASVRAWLIARWSHAGGIGFFLGALAVFLALVMFTDLAFGWSTTLSLSAVNLEGLVRALALPWSWVFVDAVPSSEVIEATRYYRSEGVLAPPPQPAMLGLWWSFLVLAMLVYGFVPRLLSFVIAGWLLKRSVRQAYLAHPQTRTLLERLTPPRVESQGPMTHDAAFTAAHVDLGTVWPAASPGQTLINWSSVPLDDRILLRATKGKSVLLAGGSRPLVEDQALLEEIPVKCDASVLVVCKAWEPPVLDLQDFLGALDEATPHGVEVMPISIDAGLPVVPNARDRGVWQRAFVANKHRLVSPPETRT